MKVGRDYSQHNVVNHSKGEYVREDVYVNNVVSRKAPKFEKKRKGGKEIKKLYKDKLLDLENGRNAISKPNKHGLVIVEKEIDNGENPNLWIIKIN